MSYPNGNRGLKKAMNDIRKQNKRKKEMIKDKKTPKPYRITLKFEDNVTRLPKVKRKNRRKK